MVTVYSNLHNRCYQYTYKCNQKNELANIKTYKHFQIV